MKVGGNESATKYFQSHGGSAALASKDPKTKYSSNAATKYKEELSRRCAADAKQFPGEVVITDVVDDGSASGTTTPAGNEDDFFSSWDKPTIKRPSNPPSRTGTPGINRTASPFLNAPANGDATARPKSPLASSTAAPTARAIPAAAIRKPAGPAAPRKANILGAKKKGLGAKKVDASALDFDAAERKARDEQERIAKLGYDPEADVTPAEAQIKSAQPQSTTTIVSPQPVSAARAGGFGTTNKPPGGDVDKIGMGVRKLGFGQVGGGAAASAAPKMGGFGSTSRGPVADDAPTTAREKFSAQKGISSDEFFGRAAFSENERQEAKTRLGGFEGATSISSNAYFGRPEEEVPEGDYGDLEGAARDIVRKFGMTAGDDIENLSALASEGAAKLGGE